MKHERLAACGVDGRGARTWEWKFPDGRQVTAYFRQKGERFAEHYHTGADPAKNPERFLLIAGAVLVNGDRRLDAAGGPVTLTIEPWERHSMEALEDAWYIEYRPTWFDPANPDTVPT